MTTILSAIHCLQMRRTINHFRGLCSLSTPSLDAADGSEPTYSLIKMLNTEQDNNTLDELPDVASPIRDGDEDNLICEINLNAVTY